MALEYILMGLSCCHGPVVRMFDTNRKIGKKELRLEELLDVQIIAQYSQPLHLRFLQKIHPPKFNVEVEAPEKWWLEDKPFLFGAHAGIRLDFFDWIGC